jgi:methyl-accepting chemotaxis protein
MQALPPVYYIVFTAITAFGVLLQAFVLLGIFIAMRKSTTKLLEVVTELREKALPALATTQSLLNDVSPKLKIATGNMAEISEVLRGQASHVNETVENLLEKTNAQIERVDEMVTSTFNAMSQASRVIDMAIGVPARRVNGVLHGLKVGVEVLLNGRRSAAPQPATAVAVAEPEPEGPIPVNSKSAQAV